jgi:hypothetical protein
MKELAETILTICWRSFVPCYCRTSILCGTGDLPASASTNVSFIITFISLALTSSKRTEVCGCEDLSWADLVQVSPVRTWRSNDRRLLQAQKAQRCVGVKIWVEQILSKYRQEELDEATIELRLKTRCTQWNWMYKHMVMGLQKFLRHHRRRYHKGGYGAKRNIHETSIFLSQECQGLVGVST